LLTLAVVALVLGAAFWKSAQSLHGHARAGAEAIVALLAEQMTLEKDSVAVDRAMERIDLLLPGLGAPVAVRVVAGSRAIDRSLASLNLRGRSGATVLAIVREGEQVLVPRGRDMLRAGDVLAVAGTPDAVAAARTLIEVRKAPAMQDDRADDQLRVGLCAGCVNVQVIENRRGSRFYRCRLAEIDPAFLRYPPLPVLSCRGFEPITDSAASEGC
ncbi:MAG: hypothetical protein JJD97_10895, partial [Gemmatimonadaceae bacterium]|nr:hypothetical protein [Gemmatimonadaceae bacterium]